jgi:hypothetical protein
VRVTTSSFENFDMMRLRATPDQRRDYCDVMFEEKLERRLVFVARIIALVQSKKQKDETE